MKVQTSVNFKKETKKTIFSIFVFIITYLLLFALSIGLTAACIYGGIWIIRLIPNILTLGLGLGLIASAFTILFYLLKFIFASSKRDISNLTEINAIDEPQLFALIAEIVKEVDTKFPKKVYLSYDVNACVFYDSNFWSMFFPIRKNLQIGIGLVNSVTQQELKAILAHEFGHFSQKSMKVGSYVYNVNEIIYNMLYKNESINKMNEQWSSINGYAVIFIRISMSIIRGIQKILEKLYSYININYMALSREMEFHADEIAAHVAGSKALSESLLRLSFSSFALDHVLNYYDTQIKQNLKSENLYKEQLVVIEYFAKKYKYAMSGMFPDIGLNQIKKYNKSKLNIENQWASHPSDEDRIKALDSLNIVKSNIDDSPAIKLFANNAHVAKQISDRIFEQIQYTELPKELSLEQFSTDFIKEIEEGSFDAMFNGFYDNNNPVIEKLAYVDKSSFDSSPEQLFSDQRIETIYELSSLKNDQEALLAIQDGEIKIKSFDYDQTKYPVQEASVILQQVEKEIEKKKLTISNNNEEVFRYYYTVAKDQNKEDQLFSLYYEFAKIDQANVEELELYAKLIENTRFIFQTTAFNEITSYLVDLQHLEIKLKTRLKVLLETPLLADKIDQEHKESLQKYLENTLSYFYIDTYNDENLSLLFSAIHHYQGLILQKYFLKKQEILKFQKELTLSINNVQQTEKNYNFQDQ
ncbi:M48 family metalloprotease [Sphingobacterium sp. SRCM116780]|uniref:M48 family metalloprotease n=1 Tax=Sphingobacterium sp. SRCM116780 TaxID=2907623 RepID=UPI001F3114D0|nr:M48 family metallopeptidase [Sphingobacterium sp. SRCM116780]UIR57722.1 M48 family metalloprotease [Sphingobacterium sp. SRCM116780]